MRQLGLIVSLFVFAAGTQGQQWSVSEQEIIDHVQSLWEANHFVENSYEKWVAAARPDPGYQMWWTYDGHPAGLDIAKTVRNYTAGSKTAQIAWYHIWPVSVRHYGDFAAIWYYARFNIADKDGVNQSHQLKRLDMFARRDGNWHLLGGTSTPGMEK